MAWLTGWSYRQKITTDSNGISLSGNVSNKTVVVRIPASNTDFWTNVNSDGGDVRFTQSDGETLLKKSTIKFDSTGDDALYLVKIPTVDATTDTEIYVYYNKAGATTDDDTANTLESDCVAYWPLDLNHADGAFVDIASTNDGTNTGSTDAAGQVGRGREFSGTGQYITCGTGMGLSGDRTIAASINGVHGAAALHAIVAKYGASSAVQDFYFSIYQQKIRGLVADTNYATRVTNGSTALSDNTTYLVGMSHDASSTANHVVLWLNGADDSGTTADAGTPITTMNSSAEPVVIGARINGTSGLYDGIIDDVAVFNTVKSADWWKAENASRVGTWLTFAGQENLDFTVTDASVGTDAVSIVAKAFTISDTASGADSISLPLPMADTGAGVDGVSVTVYVVIAEAKSVTDSVGLASKDLTIPDTASGADGASDFTGDIKAPSDTAGGADGASITVHLSISDTALGTDGVALSGNLNTLLLVALDFPAGETLEYQVADGDGNILQDYTSSGVLEMSDGHGESEYRVWFSKISDGIVRWRIPGTTWKAREVINKFSSLADGVNFTGSRAGKLDFLDRANSEALASADYTAPDNAGIVANGAAIAAMQGDVTSMAGDVTSILADTELLIALNKNKRYLEKVGTTWYLVIRNDNDTGDLVRKALKGTNGTTEIMDIQAAAMGMEMKSSV